MGAGGFVLTGGKSTRMGLDKALLPLRGRTMVECVAEEVMAACGSVCLVGAPERYQHLGLTCLPERYPSCGPLSGLEAALDLGACPWSLVVACDMPGLSRQWLSELVGKAEASGASAVVAVDAQGRLEPLCAVYHASLLPLIRKALDEGRYTVHKLLEEIPVERVQAPLPELVRNVNTSEEWRAWSR
jgi:molybdopterin-guanine dinucleotide biosynthesis protein A